MNNKLSRKRQRIGGSSSMVVDATLEGGRRCAIGSGDVSVSFPSSGGGRI